MLYWLNMSFGVYFFICKTSCCTLFGLHFFCVAHFFYLILFSCCTFFHATLFSCSTFSVLHFFHVTLFSCCTFFVLHSFHIAPFFRNFFVLFLLWFFMLHLFRVTLSKCCSYFKLHVFHALSFFILQPFHPEFSSRCTHVSPFFVLHYFHVVPFLHFFHVVSFFVLHSFYASPFFLLRSFLGLVLFMMHFLSFAYPLGWHSFHAAIFLCYTFFSLDLNFWPFSCFTHFMMPFFSLLSFTLRTFHIALFHVALISCCKFLLLYSLHITPSQGVKMAPKPKLHLIMHLPQWVFKTAGLPRTLSVFL